MTEDCLVVNREENAGIVIYTLAASLNHTISLQACSDTLDGFYFWPLCGDVKILLSTDWGFG